MALEIKFNGAARAQALPRALHDASRSAVPIEPDPCLDGVVEVVASYDVFARARGIATEAKAAPHDDQIVALEAEEGVTLFVSAQQLAEDVQRTRPEAMVDGALDLTKLDSADAASRGELLDNVWRALHVLDLNPDVLIERARAKALEWAGEKAKDAAVDLTSHLGAKALMYAIESQLAGAEGLYEWTAPTLRPEDFRPKGDPRLDAIAKQGLPVLVLIHGTASSTTGSFSGLRDQNVWSSLTARFPGGIFGFEHRTFSKSPTENALELLSALPAGCKVSFLTHSRGGLVGDLCCLAALRAEEIEQFGVGGASHDDAKQRELMKAVVAERALLAQLEDTKLTKRLQLERYVRVACPARGTRLLSENLPLFLSGLLTFVQRAGSWAASALATPAVGTTTSSLLGVVKRIVLEIVKRRLDPLLVPGIAAMSAQSPLAAFLATHARRSEKLEVAVVSGDTEFDGIAFNAIFRRVANIFADWALFDGVQNDLVVDTDSMYGGLGWDTQARYLFDQDGSVSHFNYFQNALTRDALQEWLSATNLDDVKQFVLQDHRQPLPWPRRTRTALRGEDRRPLVVLVPGFMGTSLALTSKSADVPRPRVFIDPQRLALGANAVLRGTDESVGALDLFESSYGQLADYLEPTYRVVRFAYDWRRSIEDNAALLITELEQHAREPIHILAHGSGGLLVRRAMQLKAASWAALTRSGRVVMLGTPHAGSASFVHSLLGKTLVVRQLALLQPDRDLKSVVAAFGSWPGALELLPRSAGANANPFDVEFWARARERARDRTFGDRSAWQADAQSLGSAARVWQTLAQTPATIDRVVCVHGQSAQTPYGITLPESADAPLKLLFTRRGDGLVTWQSSHWSAVAANRHYLMPVEHADLVQSAEHFEALLELLGRGETTRLERFVAPQATQADDSFVRDAEPALYPTSDEIVRAAMGSRPRRSACARVLEPLLVRVRADNVLNAQDFVLCGHYSGDAIAGVEAILDDMLGGRLAERERLGLYADELGTSALVVLPQSAEQKLRRQRQGAIVVGLGDLNGQLSSQSVTKTVRAAVLRTLMTIHDAMEQGDVRLISVLIGYNSSPNFSIAESIAAVTQGVLEANHEFSSVSSSGDARTRVRELTFYEVFLDSAITAARSLRELPTRLESELRRARARLQIQPTLERGTDYRHRLSAAPGLGYWPRLIVTDADRDEDGECPPECYETRIVSPMPAALRDRVCNHEPPCDCASQTARTHAPRGLSGAHAPRGLNGAYAPLGSSDTDPPPSADPPPSVDPPQPSKYYPARLRYVFLSQRARAESIVQQRQPGLLESLVRQQSNSADVNRDLGRLLFQLMIPLDFKTAAREQRNLVLVVDTFSADMPWEMLQADDKPFVIGTALVRQFTTSEFRRGVRTALRNWAYVIADPKTTDFESYFGPPALPQLDEALREGEAIRAVLERTWQIERAERAETTEVLAKLYARPYRLIVIAAHGGFDLVAKDGSRRTGVVLSHGAFLTAVEISQMEVVPELVFVNCCHLGQQRAAAVNGAPHRLAHSFARELINMGVRCVVAAGWAVDDAAARTFSETFFQELIERHNTFGMAVHVARKTTWEKHPATNTWGAYQAYGDPGYKLSRESDGDSNDIVKPASIDELLDELAQRTSALHKRRGRGSKRVRPESLAELERWAEQQLAECPAEWARSPEVHQALAKLFAELGPEGFEKAREHYLRALSGRDDNGRVAICAIEQLANLEARHALKLWRSALSRSPVPAELEQERKRALSLVKTAGDRIRALIELSEPWPDPSREPPAPNVERWGILGSAYKRHAWILASASSPWTAQDEPGASVKALIEKARDAYATALGPGVSADAYLLVNRVQLDWLLGTPLDSNAEQALLERAKQLALREFDRTHDFFRAISQADIEATLWLLSGAPAKPGELTGYYRAHLKHVPHSARELASVTDQHHFLADLLRCKAPGLPSDQRDLADSQAASLEELAHALESGTL